MLPEPPPPSQLVGLPCVSIHLSSIQGIRAALRPEPQHNIEALAFKSEGFGQDGAARADARGSHF
eukprot:1161189-Pelagomonas_calceolata.AAC.12